MPIHFTHDSGARVLERSFCAIANRTVKTLLNAFKQIKRHCHSWSSESVPRTSFLFLGSIISGVLGFWIALESSSDVAQAHTVNIGRIVFLLFSLFVFLVLGVGLWIYFRIAGPLSKLGKYLDQTNIVEGIPLRIPDYGYLLPEIRQLFKSFEGFLKRVKVDRDSRLKGLLREKRRSDVITATILDGIILLRGDEILYLNPIGARILGLPSDQGIRGMRLRRDTRGLNSEGLAAVKQAIGHAIPVEFNLNIDERKSYYLIQTIPLTGDLIESIELASDPIYERILDRFSGDTLVLAHDVTLIREGQEAKGHFLATISHEIKTPVTSLTLATRLLKKSIDQIPNVTHRELIETCVENVDRLRSLLDDLLTTSRLETIAHKLEIQTVDFRKLVRHSIESFTAEAKKKNIDLSSSLGKGERINIGIDAAKLTWAMSNLITNAIRHTPKGGKVVVELDIKEEFVLVKIRDTGPGIERCRQDTIFEKFSPYYDLRVARSGIAGAGLAIAKEIVIAHGGKIWVSSQPGLGSEFNFTLPHKNLKSVIVGTSTKQVINENRNLKLE